MKILCTLNSFKGSCNSVDANKTLDAGLQSVMIGSDIQLLPLFDGGDGSIDGLHYHLGLKKIMVQTVNPLMRKIKAAYLWDEKNKVAYIEMAVASGIALFKNKAKNNILNANTYGTGILIKHATEQKGIKKIILLIGGSATNDAGLGILAALGFTFLNRAGKKIKPYPFLFSTIDSIKSPLVVSNIPVEIWTDVTNPFTGKLGAVNVFSAQKGADRKKQIILEKGMVHLQKLFKKNYLIDLQKIAGTGAAGGIGGGMITLLGAKIENGTQKIFELLDVENKIKNTNIVITGEGSLDTQSTYGKLVNGICNLAHKYHKPVIAICGINNLSEKEKNLLHLRSIFSIVKGPTTVDHAMHHWKKNIYDAGVSIGGLLNLSIRPI